jgi:predicted TPR repeat methyltransferase
MNAIFEQARAFFLQGVAHYEAGRIEQAERQFAASLSLVPGRASTLTNLGAARLRLGRFAEAEEVLAQAVAAEPGNPEALGHHATALAELGRTGEALPLVDAALRIDDRPGVLWTLRGNLLRDLGRQDQAAQSFKTALQRGGDVELNRYYLAALGGGETPPRPPARYVQALFDNYADGFEEHLVEALNYRAPAVLVQGLNGRRFGRALDLGCGTGLCGSQLRPHVDHLSGVDLSQNMVERARRRGVYDDLRQGDVVDYLRASAPVDLIVAADVFIYLGALEPIFEAAARVLERGGVFCFTVELAGDEHSLLLRPSMRYAHSGRYIRSLAERNGFEFIATSERAIRDDQSTPIAGLFAWLSKV